ncbi:LuxR family transcriptional regulator [Clostridium fermenticellae]|uniref:LuxR family transcriptional regulator n=1 Tax=Clostridium fermenticellae TaxID=2068654 RepID=A0A386H5S9_9CLOT|nr:LuxR C-terminal-related transcriptional regulator [Clostridium fermenticellae]AYD40875.1 LuxR family transcriptional regulator [Clostridium fermenticellae]
MLDYSYKNKFMIPKRKNKVVGIKKVLNKLDNALNKKFTIISAKAGSGKTTVVMSWIYSRNLEDNIIWISLNERDNNQDIFWKTVTLAVQGQSDSLANLKLENILSLDKNMIFVFDNLQVIKDENVLDQIKKFVYSVPNNVHIIAVSRERLNINVSKLRLDGEVTEIFGEELVFSLEDTKKFLESNLEFTVTKQCAQILNNASNGWAAGIKIAALSVNTENELVELCKDFDGSNRYIQDYFSEEVFDYQSEEIKEFLLKTCVLDELDEYLCNYITTKQDSQKLLEKMYDENLFTNKLDYSGKIFRYDKLFKEFLISKIDNEDKEKINELGSKVAYWYEKNGFIDKAVNQYINVKNYTQAISLVEGECLKKVFTNEYFYVLNWLKRIPQDVIVGNPRFCMVYMYINLYDDTNYSKYKDLVNKSIKNRDEKYKNECIAILNIIIGDKNFISSNYEKSIEYYKESLKNLEHDEFWNTVLNLKLGLTYFYLNDFESEKKFFENSINLSREHNEATLKLTVNRVIIFTDLIMGRLNECENICNLSLNDAIANGMEGSQLISIFYMVLAFVYYEKNCLEKAEQYVLRGLEIAEEWDVYPMFIGYYIYSGISLKDNKNKSNKILKKLNEFFVMDDYSSLLDKYYFLKLRDYFKALKVKRLIECGKAKWVEDYIVNRDFKIKVEFIVFSDALMYKGKLDDSLMVLNVILASMTERDSKYLSIMAYIFRAEIFSKKNQYENATKDFRMALILGYNDSFVRFFFLHDQKSIKVLIKTIQSMMFNKDYYGMEKYLNTILNLYSTDEDCKILSKREKEVLLLIEKGAKNSEIAKNLFITESTAKSHILNIFTKLGVKNRIRAVSKARDMGII